MEYAIVEVPTGNVVPQHSRSKKVFEALNVVRLPNKDNVFNPQVGYEWPPQYPDEDNDPVVYRLYEVTNVVVGSGPRTADISAPIFDPVADTVTVTKTLAAALPRVIPDALKDVPASVTSVPALRDAVNLLLAHLRGDS